MSRCTAFYKIIIKFKFKLKKTKQNKTTKNKKRRRELSKSPHTCDSFNNRTTKISVSVCQGILPLDKIQNMIIKHNFGKQAILTQTSPI
jgi:hypothetical protein